MVTLDGEQPAQSDTPRQSDRISCSLFAPHGGRRGPVACAPRAKRPGRSGNPESTFGIARRDDTRGSVGWVPTNVVAVARLAKRKSQPRGTLNDDEFGRCLRARRRSYRQASSSPSSRCVTPRGGHRCASFRVGALRWEDLSAGRLVIDSSIVILRSGDGLRRPTLRDDPTKTANRRVVTLDAVSINQLELLMAEYGTDVPWILSSGPGPVSPERVTAWWRRARDRAGVDTRWRFARPSHWFRDYVNRRRSRRPGCRQSIGHANPSMTLRTYAHAVEAADAPIARH